MMENRIYAGAALLLGLLSYLSVYSKPDAEPTTDVVLVDMPVEQLERVELMTETATVKVTRSPTAKPVVIAERRDTAARFTGNDQLVEALDSFAHLRAARSLGAMSDEALVKAQLSPPQGKLRLGFRDREHEVAIGGETKGGRYTYAKMKEEEQVVLLESGPLNKLKAARSRYMQRSLRDVDMKDVHAIELRAGSEENRFLHRNRLSPRDAFWARPETEGAFEEGASNFIDKINRLGVSRYLSEEEATKPSSTVLEVKWLGEADEVLETLALERVDGERPRYVARSTATQAPVEVPSYMAEQIERDRHLVFESISAPADESTPATEPSPAATATSTSVAPKPGSARDAATRAATGTATSTTRTPRPR